MRLTPDPASDANKWIGFRLGFKVESVGVSAVFTFVAPLGNGR